MLITYPFPVHKCRIHDQIDIAYMDEGSGDQTILFIHGLANYAPVWKYQLQELSLSSRCIAIDLPGNGYSSRGDFPYSMFFYAECIARFTEKMNLQNIVLAGHSMGGQIAFIVALRYPHLIEKMVLIAPAGLEYFAPHEIMLMQGMMNINTLFHTDEMHLESAIRQSFFNPRNESSTIIDELKAFMYAHPLNTWREMCVRSINGMLNEQVQPFLKDIMVPSLLLFGSKDALIPNTLIHFGETPESIARKGASLLPKAGYEMIPNGGHFVHMENAGLINKKILSFLHKPYARAS